MMTGQRIAVFRNQFGPCFIASTRLVGIFDMGYDFFATRAHGGIVQGLDPTSNAARAGLRQGDHILRGGPGDGVQYYADHSITLSVERDGTPVAITFLPRGKPMEVPQWSLIGRLRSATPPCSQPGSARNKLVRRTLPEKRSISRAQSRIRTRISGTQSATWSPCVGAQLISSTAQVEPTSRARA